jgi:hypothetical protein
MQQLQQLKLQWQLLQRQKRQLKHQAALLLTLLTLAVAALRLLRHGSHRDVKHCYIRFVAHQYHYLHSATALIIGSISICFHTLERYRTDSCASAAIIACTSVLLCLLLCAALCFFVLL